MYLKGLLIALFVGLVISLSARAADTSPPDLRQGCRGIVALANTGIDPGNQMDEAYCLGYVTAALDMLSMTRQLGSKLYNVCMPEKHTLGQAIRVFVKYMDDHPEDLHHPESVIVLFALGTAFPCSDAAE